MFVSAYISSNFRRGQLVLGIRNLGTFFCTFIYSLIIKFKKSALHDLTTGTYILSDM